MRNTWIFIALVLTCSALVCAGCATKRCLERYSTMPSDEAIRSDGELLQQLVEKRQQAAQELQGLAEGSSERGSIEFSIHSLFDSLNLAKLFPELSDVFFFGIQGHLDRFAEIGTLSAIRRRLGGAFLRRMSNSNPLYSKK